jgi:hypothetical protein
MLVLALGRYGGLAWLLTYLPVIGSFRAPVRYIVLMQLALTILAAIAFEDLGRCHDRLSRHDILILAIPAALSVVTTVALNGYVPPIGSPHQFSPLPQAAPGVLFMLLTTGLFVMAARQIPGALVAIVALTAIDLGIWGLVPMYRESPRTIASLIARVPRPPDDPALSYAYVDQVPALPGDMLALAGYRLTSGYMALTPKIRYRVDSAAGQRLAGAHWRFSVDAWKTTMEAPVDRARLLADVQVPDDFGRDVRAVDLDRTALVEHPIRPLVGPPGTATVLVDRPGHLVVKTSAPGRQLLALTEREHPGWTATTDGNPVATVNVYGDFLGCVVGAGTHRVEFRFKPKSFENGAIVSAIGLILLPLGFAAVRR